MTSPITVTISLWNPKDSFFKDPAQNCNNLPRPPPVHPPLQSQHPLLVPRRPLIYVIYQRPWLRIVIIFLVLHQSTLLHSTVSTSSFSSPEKASSSALKKSVMGSSSFLSFTNSLSYPVLCTGSFWPDSRYGIASHILNS